ncbi:MAG: pyridoxal-phosphate dependent enzyme [Nitriliruptorales bacterium]|nr:pyridoxal-phosphate dependent enzyme [Nitriliruptorales bacterium]
MTVLPRPVDVDLAAERIAPHIRRTPTWRVHIAGFSVWLKLEHLQVTGSFKARGATNALLSLAPRPAAVVAASGGNHGLAVAHAAAATGIDATIVVPEAVPDEKARRLAASGASVVRHGDQYAQAEAQARHIAAAMRAPFIHPYADPAVIAGQGTVAREVLRDVKAQFDVLLVAVGGGGLISGCATACRDSSTRVVGVEPEGIPTLRAALDARQPVEVDVRSITASALGARVTAPLNLAIAQEAVDDVVLVSDDDIVRARDLLWSSCRLAVEPGSAAGLAALLAGAVEAEAPCVVLCGANTTWTPS